MLVHKFNKELSYKVLKIFIKSKSLDFKDLSKYTACMIASTSIYLFIFQHGHFHWNPKRMKMLLSLKYLFIYDNKRNFIVPYQLISHENVTISKHLKSKWNQQRSKIRVSLFQESQPLLFPSWNRFEAAVRGLTSW